MSEQQTGWRQVKIGELLTEHSERSISSNQHEVLSVTKDGIFSQREYFKKQIASEDNSGYKVVKRGDVVFSAMNLWMGSIDVVKDQEIGIVSPAYITMRPTEGLIDTGFLGHFLRGDEMRKKYVQHSQQGASIVRRNLNKDDLLDDEVCIPPLPEQKKIAEILSGIEGAIHRRRCLLEKVTLLASRSFNQVIDRIATEHPITTVESVTTKVVDGPHLTPNYQERGVPFVTVKNISSGKLDLTNTKFITADDHADFCMRGKAEHGDILYSKDGSIGHTCVVPKEYDFSFFVSVALLKTNKELIYPEYLNAVLQSTLVKTQTELMSEGSGLKHMVLRSIKALKIPLPPLDEQIRLMAQLLPVFKSREIIEDSIQRMAYFREGIASDLLSGRKRVSV